LTDEQSVKPVHSPDEMCAIIDGLSAEAKQRLTLCAQRLANTLAGVDAQDLMQEAFVAVAEGRRHCPKDVDVVAFFCNAMKSNLFNIRRKSKMTVSATNMEDELDAIADDNPEKWIERMEEMKLALHEVKEAFGDDDRPMMVFEGRAEGMSREEIRDLVDLGPVQFESFEKKLRRFANKSLASRRAK
jgi:DNA-directed RNA polymerase specialized sigma24 family protein